MDHLHQFGQHAGPMAGFGGVPPFIPFIGGTMLFLLLLLGLGGFFLARTGRIGPPPWLRAGRLSPEFEARKILSQRFANSEIDGDEFLERASILNWTPGVEPLNGPRKGKGKRR